MGKRRRFTADFKARIALEALKEDCTVAELASKHRIHPTQIGKWKSHVKQNVARFFDGGEELGRASVRATCCAAVRRDRAAEDGTQLAGEKNTDVR
jgi:transposase-like protein